MVPCRIEIGLTVLRFLSPPGIIHRILDIILSGHIASGTVGV